MSEIRVTIDRQPERAERTVATRTNKIAVSGRIDRLDARPRASKALVVSLDTPTQGAFLRNSTQVVGTIQSGGGRDAELQNRLMTRLAEASGRQVVYNNLGQSVRQPDAWKQHMALIEETAKAGTLNLSPFVADQSDQNT